MGESVIIVHQEEMRLRVTFAFITMGKCTLNFKSYFSAGF